MPLSALFLQNVLIFAGAFADVELLVGAVYPIRDTLPILTDCASYCQRHAEAYFIIPEAVTPHGGADAFESFLAVNKPA